jgi:hypothetical protein
MRAIVNFWVLPGTSSSSMSSGFGALGSGLIDFGSMGNSHSGSSMGALAARVGVGAAALAANEANIARHVNPKIPFNVQPLIEWDDILPRRDHR